MIYSRLSTLSSSNNAYEQSGLNLNKKRSLETFKNYANISDIENLDNKYHYFIMSMFQSSFKSYIVDSKPRNLSYIFSNSNNSIANSYRNRLYDLNNSYITNTIAGSVRDSYSKLFSSNLNYKLTNFISFDNVKMYIQLTNKIQSIENIDERNELVYNFALYLFKSNVFTKEQIENEFKQTLTKDEDYLDQLINGGSKNKIQIVFERLNGISLLLKQIDKDKILIDNTAPYLANLYESIKQNDLNYFHLTDLSEIFMLQVESSNSIDENNTLNTEVLLNRNKKNLRVNNTLNILSTAKEVAEYQSKKVFSRFPKELLKEFDAPIVLDHYLPINLGLAPSYTKLNRDPMQSSSDFNVGAFAEMSFIGDCFLNSPLQNSYDYNSVTSIEDDGNQIQTAKRLWELENKIKESKGLVQRISLSELVNNALSGVRKVKAMKFVNTVTRNTEIKGLGIEFKELKPNQLLQNHAFIPVMFKIKYDDYETLNNGSPQKEGYYLVLVNFDTLSTFQKYSSYQNLVLNFANHVSDLDEFLIHTDYETYINKKNKKIGAYGKYIDNYIVLKRLFKDNENALINFVKTDDQNYLKTTNKYINDESISYLFSKPKIVNKDLEMLKEARDTVKQKIKDKLKSLKDELIEKQKIANTKINIKRNIESLRNQYQSIQSELNSKKISNLNEVLNYSKSFNEISTSWSSLQEDFKKDVEKAFLEKQFTLDPYIQNFGLNNIHLLELKYNEDSITINNNSTEKEILDFRKAFKNPKLSKVLFVVDKIVRIKVDGKENNCIYGGPYKIEVTSNSLNIGLLNRSSLFGKEGDDCREFRVHPHASSLTYSGNDEDFLTALYGNMFRGCLGETTPYLYHAFSENNIGMIILHCLIWLSSANSADYWGRTWTWFPKQYKDNGYIFLTPEVIAQQLLNEDLPNSSLHNDECDCEYDTYGTCYHCGDYCEDYDESCEHSYDQDGECIYCGDEIVVNDIEREAVNQIVQTINNLPINEAYIPYVQTDNNNNDNEG